MKLSLQSDSKWRVVQYIIGHRETVHTWCRFSIILRIYSLCGMNYVLKFKSLRGKLFVKK